MSPNFISHKGGAGQTGCRFLFSAANLPKPRAALVLVYFVAQGGTTLGTTGTLKQREFKSFIVASFLIDNTCGQATGIRNTKERRARATAVEYGNSMEAIVTKDQAIPEATANAACRSLDEEIARKRDEGALEAGKSSSVDQHYQPANIAPVQSLGGNPEGKLNIACPIVYSDVLTVPKWSPSSAPGYGIIGIIALGTFICLRSGTVVRLQ